MYTHTHAQTHTHTHTQTHARTHNINTDKRTHISARTSAHAEVRTHAREHTVQEGNTSQLWATLLQSNGPHVHSAYPDAMQLSLHEPAHREAAACGVDLRAGDVHRERALGL